MLLLRPPDARVGRQRVLNSSVTGSTGTVHGLVSSYIEATVAPAISHICRYMLQMTGKELVLAPEGCTKHEPAPACTYVTCTYQMQQCFTMSSGRITHSSLDLDFVLQKGMLT